MNLRDLILLKQSHKVLNLPVGGNASEITDRPIDGPYFLDATGVEDTAAHLVYDYFSVGFL